ncbi:MAG: cellulase family glycosylhydrolase [Chitinispirillia bacterium]|nr:cellulase family glycosylhydrolase [Chitinispirillia bacterium]
MKSNIFSLSLAVLASVTVLGTDIFAQTPPAGSPVARHGQLSVSGARLVNKDGVPVQLRGMSFYWSNSRSARNFYNAGAVKWLADDWKVSVVRAAMSVEEDFWTDELGYISDPNGNRQRVAAVVDGAIANGVYVIIDWHSHAAERYQSQAVSFFEDMARTYGNRPNVIYEIYNEPLGISNPDSTWKAIKPYQQAVVNAIRAIDGKNPIIIGTPGWCQRPDVAAADPLSGDNLLYSLHFYAGENSHRASLRNNAYAAMRRGQAVFVSEFGPTGASGSGNYNEAETNTWFRFLEQFKISWASWAIHTTNETNTSYVLKSGASANGNWQESQLHPYGVFIRNKLRAADASEPAGTPEFFEVTINVAGSGVVTRSRTPVPEYLFLQRGTEVTLSSQPDTGWTLQAWSGDFTGTGTSASFTVNSDMVITATFVPQGTPVLPGTAGAGMDARWTVRKVDGGIAVGGPFMAGGADVIIYNMLGKVVQKTAVSQRPNGQAALINNIRAPAGNYFVSVRDRASGREVYRTRLLMAD